MARSLKFFWSAVVIASMSMVACGQKKDDNKGKQSSTGTAKKEGVINNKPVSIEISNIAEVSGSTDTSRQYSFTLKLNNKSETTQTVKFSPMASDGNIYGSGWAAIDTMNTYWIARCDTPECNFVFITAFATDSQGQKYVQIGAVRSNLTDAILASVGYPEQVDTVVTPQIISMDEMMNLLMEKAHFADMGF